MKRLELNQKDQLALPNGKWSLNELGNIVLDTPGWASEKRVTIEPKMLNNPEMFLTVLRHPNVDKNEFLRVYFDAIDRHKIKKLEIQFIKKFG